MYATFFVLLLLGAAPEAVELKAGVARKVITPTEPIWMSGYASRSHPSEGVTHDLWAKALWLEDAAGGCAILVTADLLGLPREVSDQFARRVMRHHKLERRQLLLNFSHTHAGPAVSAGRKVMHQLSPSDEETLQRYQDRLIDDLVAVVAAAHADLAPAQLALGHGAVEIATNRREPTEKGIRLGVNPKGPVDRDVPVISVRGHDGKVRAVLFGYACHNTTMGGDNYRLHGDYAGFAQIELEKALPGTTAMFLMLCGADQNPHPRGTLELATKHGTSLASDVQRVLEQAMKPVRPRIATAYVDVKLPFAPQERATFEAEVKSDHRFRKRRGEAMLAALDAGRPVVDVTVPVQAVRFDDKAVLLAIGGEVVVDYALRLKREMAPLDLIVAGYSNDVMCYISSRRLIQEGGYEVNDSMVYYGKPGPLAESAEETLVKACRRVVEGTP